MVCFLFTVLFTALVLVGSAAGLAYLWERYGVDLWERYGPGEVAQQYGPGEVAQQYGRRVTESPAELSPLQPVCCFCRQKAPWCYRIEPFEVADPVSGLQRWGPAWYACDRCQVFVEAGNWAGLELSAADYVQAAWAEWAVNTFRLQRPALPTPVEWVGWAS